MTIDRLATEFHEASEPAAGLLRTTNPRILCFLERISARPAGSARILRVGILEALTTLEACAPRDDLCVLRGPEKKS